MPRPNAFRLPRVEWAMRGTQLLSFQRSAHDLLGEYTVSNGAVVVDPFATNAISPEAVAVHELQHQFLTINTAFGIFTQTLTFMASHGFGHDALVECYEKQWCVQELAATYAEMCFVASRQPQFFEQEVRKLPSARLDQPPYRELFEEISSFLPVDPAKPRPVLDAQATLISMLGAAAMNSDCLLRMAAMQGPESLLHNCMQDSPHSRLEQIVPLLHKRIRLENMSAELASKIESRREDPNEVGRTLMVQFNQIITLVPEIIIQPDLEIIDQHKKASHTWRSVRESLAGGAIETIVSRLTEDPFPSIYETRKSLSPQAVSPHNLPPGGLHERLALTLQRGLGISLEFAIREPSQAFLTGRSYFMKPGQARLPIEGQDQESETALPDDILGLISTADIVRELNAFPSLPHIAVYIDDSWRKWKQVPGAGDCLKASVQACRQTDLSLAFIRDNILGFEGLHEGVQMFMLRFAPGQIAGCFFSKLRPGVYGLQKVPAEFGMQLFLKICDELKITSSQESDSNLRKGLFNMIGLDYSWPYGGSKPAK